MAKFKKFLPIVGILIALLAVVAFVLISNSSTPKEPEEVQTKEELPKAKLEIFQKGVTIKLAGTENFIEAVEGQEIDVGTAIKTDATGRGQLVYPDRSVTRIGELSEIVLQEFNPQEKEVKVELLSGKIWSRVAKILGKGSYETESQNLIASVRGTSFGHEILPNGQDRLISTRRQVRGGCKNKTQEVDINAGRKATFNCRKGSRVSPQLITNQDRRDKWFIFNNDEDKRLDERFNKETYDDEEQVLGATPSPTRTPTPKRSPTPTPTPAPTQASSPSNPTSTTTATPITISGVGLICNPYLTQKFTTQVAQTNCDGHTVLYIQGSGFDASQKPQVYSIDASSGKVYTADEVVVQDSNVINWAHFSDPLVQSTYHVKVVQGQSSAELQNAFTM